MTVSNELRWHPLLSQWVLVAISTASRPWSGQLSKADRRPAPAFDPGCYLCPGVTRSSGERNPAYPSVWAFDNDYASLNIDDAADSDNAPITTPSVADQRVLQLSRPAIGICRVICWSPHHDKTFADLDEKAMQQVVRFCADQYRTLSARPEISAILIFENKGAEVGASNPHPHGQLYASGFVPDYARRMRDSQAAWARQHDGRSMLQALLKLDVYQQELLVHRGSGFSIIVPWFARYAYETWIVPHRPLEHMARLSANEMADLAECLQIQATSYNAFFECNAPSMLHFHNAPCDGHASNRHWCFHVAALPPLRDRDRMKFMAGWETGSNNITNPVAPAQAAGQLREALARKRSAA